MGHLLDYEQARTTLERALAAIECAERKSSRAGAWWWAEVAIEHAAELGVANAHDLVGGGRWPELAALRSQLRAMDDRDELIVVNAFSVNMLPPGTHRIQFQPLTQDEATRLLQSQRWTSAVGHETTAALFSTELGVTIPANRATVTMWADVQLLVGQYVGPRLPEGATELPAGATVTWWLVSEDY